MSKKILVEASELWDYIQKNREDLERYMHKVAYNDEFGVEVYVTVDNDLARIVVEADSTTVYEEDIISEKDCKYTAELIYNDYLSTSVVNILGNEDMSDEGGDLVSHFDIEDRIEEREAELDDALYAFLGAVFDDDYHIFHIEDDAFRDIKEHFLEYLSRKWDFQIRRPMYLEGEDGEDFFEEYPYEYMIFDDEDNPIYQHNHETSV